MKFGPSHPAVLAVAVAVAAAICFHDSRVFAFGQLPLVSEEPSSPCAGTLQTDIAYGIDLVGPGQDLAGQQAFRSHLDMSAPILLTDYGLTGRFEGRLAGEIPLTTVSPDNGQLATGWGDVSGGLKYRFMDQIGGPQYSTDTCDPPQDGARYGLQGPVSISIFPQFSFPTGSVDQGLGSGGYSVEFPFDVARQFGGLYLVGEALFLWEYHRKSVPNEFELGLAASYSVTDQWDLMGEHRVNLPTSGHGAASWFMDLGSQYQLNDYVAVFGAVGTGVAATSAVAASNFTLLVGTEITLPID